MTYKNFLQNIEYELSTKVSLSAIFGGMEAGIEFDRVRDAGLTLWQLGLSKARTKLAARKIVFHVRQNEQVRLISSECLESFAEAFNKVSSEDGDACRYDQLFGLFEN